MLQYCLASNLPYVGTAAFCSLRCTSPTENFSTPKMYLGQNKAVRRTFVRLLLENDDSHPNLTSHWEFWGRFSFFADVLKRLRNLNKNTNKWLTKTQNYGKMWATDISPCASSQERKFIQQKGNCNYEKSTLQNRYQG
jgi:hypothetical protein